MSLILGTKTVTTAGSEVPLSASSVPCGQVIIQVKRANTGFIYVGDSAVTSTLCFELAPPASATAQLSSISVSAQQGSNALNLAHIYIDSSVNGEGVTFWYEKC
jgi:hypothetical protein